MQKDKLLNFPENFVSGGPPQLTRSKGRGTRTEKAFRIGTSSAPGRGPRGMGRPAMLPAITITATKRTSDC